MIERQHLTIIRAIVRFGSLTAASKELNLSQSAISHAVAKLEDRLQVKIWQRKGHKLQLTEAGTYLLNLANRLLPELEHADMSLSQMAQGKRGTLRIGMECHPCERWLMRVTKPYLKAWPDVELEVKTAFRYDGIAALRAREIDILITPDPRQQTDVKFEPVFDYELKLVIPEEHRLSGYPIVTPEDFVSETLFILPVAKDRLDVFTRFLLPAACEPATCVHVENIDLTLQLVAAKRGITVVPDWYLNQSDEERSLHALRIGSDGLHKSIHVGCRNDETDIDYLKAFVTMAAQISGAS